MLDAFFAVATTRQSLFEVNGTILADALAAGFTNANCFIFVIKTTHKIWCDI
jgi:hypothetical protein